MYYRFVGMTTFEHQKLFPKLQLSYFGSDSARVMKREVRKVSVLGCGWTGLPLASHLVSLGYTVKGSTTHLSRVVEIAMEGVVPYIVQTGLEVEGPRAAEFFTTDALVITLPPPRMNGIPDFHLKAHRAIARIAKASGVQQIVLFNSTSVYANENRTVTEDDAKVIASPHSGVAVLDIEKCYAGNDMPLHTVLRFGGLMGPKRHPGRFLKGRDVLSNSEAPVNMTHLDDVIGATRYALESGLPAGVYNVCSPERVSRGDFYTAAMIAAGETPPQPDGESHEWKRVSSQKIIDAGYRFIHKTPHTWLR